MNTSCDAVLILHINAVRLRWSDVDHRLTIQCSGDVATTGWTSPELRPRPSATHDDPTHDGTLEFDFLAVAPTGPAAQMIEQIEAKYVCPDAQGITGIRVHSKTNSSRVSLPPA